MADATIAAIQAINAAITGIVWAPDDDELVFSVPDERLPAVLCLPGNFEAKTRLPTTVYACLVLVAKIDPGTQPAAVSTAVTLLERFRTAWGGLAGVGSRGIDPARPTATGGLGSPNGVWKTVDWGGSEYIGFQWNVPLVGSS
jgi:hypothetical protein